MHFSWKLDFSNMYEKLDPSKIDSCVLYLLEINQRPQYPVLPADIPCSFFWSSKGNKSHCKLPLGDTAASVKDVLRTWVLFHSIQPLENNKSETSKSGGQEGISINCYTTFLLGTETWVGLSSLWSLLQNNSTCLSQEKNIESGVLRVEMVEVA